jgi:hypothetical protein
MVFSLLAAVALACTGQYFYGGIAFLMFNLSTFFMVNSHEYL